MLKQGYILHAMRSEGRSGTVGPARPVANTTRVAANTAAAVG